MRKITLLSSFLLLASTAWAQNSDISLFDDSDVVVRAQTENQSDSSPDQQAEEQAKISAKNLLSQTPRKIIKDTMPEFKSITAKPAQTNTKPTFPAPFGLLWNSSVAQTRDQGIQLNITEIKDYPNSFQAFRLPKMIDFFDRIYVTFGKTDELYRILAYSQMLDDDDSANKVVSYYKTYSEYLDKKYGNMQQNFTPAIIQNTVKNEQGKETTVEEPAPIGNPEFLSQLETGTAVLYSTYHNDKVEVTLSIGVDGDKKSYIVIDYRNLQILQQQENATLDTL